MLKFNLSIFSLFVLIQLNATTAFAETKPPVKITGDHYVSARSLHQETSRLFIQNTGKEAVQQISVATDAKDLVINNSCQAGLLPNQTCKITYTYTAGKDEGKDRNSVNSKLENLSISYRIQGNSYQYLFYVVTSHIDSMRLLSLPESHTASHQLPGSPIYHYFNDTANHMLYLSTLKGLAISDDNGKNWQTLTPYNSTLNDKNDNLTPGKSAPMYSYVDGEKLYVGLWDKF